MSALSRREFVAGVLGAAALQHCRAAPATLPPGELFLPGKAAGHRLRDGALSLGRLGAVSPGRPERVERARVVIVGGGAAGLSAAWRLTRAGLRELVVLELDDAPGGTARAGASPVTPYPWGAHYIVAPLPEQRNLVALLDEMGALEPGTEPPSVAESAACREPEERIFHLGRWYSGLYLHAGASPDDRAQLQRFQDEIARWVGFRDAAGRRAFALPSSAASTAGEITALDRESFATWLDTRGLTSPRLRWLADYACRDDYGLLAADTSAWAGIAYFAARIAQPGDEAQPVVTWPEGNGRIMRHLSERIGTALRLRHLVASVTPNDGGVDVVAEAEAGAVRFSAERVILATPDLINRRIFPALDAARRARPELDRGAWAVANLHLSERPRARPDDAPLAWDNVLYDSKSLGYVVATHQSGRDHGPSVFTWYYPFTGDGSAARRALDGASREDWAEAALADLERAHPDIRPLCQRIDVAYWGHGMARPRVGSVFQPALAAARAPLGNVFFAGSELSGLSLFEEALDHGVRAAEEVLVSLGWRS